MSRRSWVLLVWLVAFATGAAYAGHRIKGKYVGPLDAAAWGIVLQDEGWSNISTEANPDGTILWVVRCGADDRANQGPWASVWWEVAEGMWVDPQNGVFTMRRGEALGHVCVRWDNGLVQKVWAGFSGRVECFEDDRGIDYTEGDVQAYDINSGQPGGRCLWSKHRRVE